MSFHRVQPCVNTWCLSLLSTCEALKSDVTSVRILQLSVNSRMVFGFSWEWWFGKEESRIHPYLCVSVTNNWPLLVNPRGSAALSAQSRFIPALICIGILHAVGTGTLNTFWRLPCDLSAHYDSVAWCLLVCSCWLVLPMHTRIGTVWVDNVEFMGRYFGPTIVHVS